MVISIRIIANNNDLVDQFRKENCSRLEVACALWRLEQIKLDLLSIEFQDEIYIEEKK